MKSGWVRQQFWLFSALKDSYLSGDAAARYNALQQEKSMTEKQLKSAITDKCSEYSRQIDSLISRKRALERQLETLGVDPG
jgi:hypothetical protein